MKIVAFATKQGRRAFRDRAAVKPGTTCYALFHEPTRLYFIWSYRDRAVAELMAQKITGPIDVKDRGANWRNNPDATIPSSITLESFNK